MNKKRKLTLKGKIIIALTAVFLLSNVIYFGSRSILKTLYPRQYIEIVEREGLKNNLDANFVYAVIKCESGFDRYAVSHLGARGLMQIMPETFTWLQQLKGTSHSQDELFEAEISIEYGCYFYGMLFERFGDEATVIAAYHAGTGNVESWLSDENYSLDGKTLNNIPFESTQEYVKRVMTTKTIYEKLYK